MRTLFFDIDGVLLGYDDKPRAKLRGDVLPSALRERGFERLVCVSGWVDLYAEPVLRLDPARQKEAIAALLADVFPDATWFTERLELAYGTDDRCRHIDLSGDWWYVDDWADEFFVKAHGEELYRRELGGRILLADPHGDGGDLLDWLRSVPDKRG